MKLQDIRTRINTQYVPSRNIISGAEAQEIVKTVRENGLGDADLATLRKEFKSKFSDAGLREFDKASAKGAPVISAAAAMTGALRSQALTGIEVTNPSAKEIRVEISFTEVAGRVARAPRFRRSRSDTDSFEVWNDKGVRLALGGFPEGTAAMDPNLPPYTMSISGLGVSHTIQRNHGISSLGPDSGSIISAGDNVIAFYKDNMARGEPEFTINFVLDEVNDYQYPQRPPVSAHSKTLKKTWNRFWTPYNDTNMNSGFDLTPTSRKKLDLKTPDDMRKLKGPAELIGIWERELDGKIENEPSFDGRFDFAFDPKTESYAMLEYTEGEGDHRLYVFDKAGEFSGYYSVADDGSREWKEAFPGELGKP